MRRAQRSAAERLRRALRWFIAFAMRLAGSIIGVAFLVIVMIEISIPGGFRATVLPSGVASPQERRLVERYRLDDNPVERLWHWITDAVRGDLGFSTRRGTPVVELIEPRIPISLELMLVSVVGALLIGIPLGLYAAANSGKARAVPADVFLGLGQSVPVYVTPFALIWLFALELQLLPAAGWKRLSESVIGNLESLILPAAVLIFAEAGPIGRLVRTSARITMDEPFVQAAMAKGLPRGMIMRRHVLRPASLSVLNVAALNIGNLLSGAIIVELAFGIGAVGQLLLRAVTDRDLYLLLALATYMVTIYVVLNSLVDAMMRAIDPRIGAKDHGRESVVSR